MSPTREFTIAIKALPTIRPIAISNMLPFEINSEKADIEAVREAINREGIIIAAEDVGGSKGRTMFVESESGKVLIRIVGQGIKEI